MKKIIFLVSILFFLQTSYTQSSSQLNTGQIFKTAQIESTITLLQDSVRVNSLIRNLQLIVESRKIIDTVSIPAIMNPIQSGVVNFSLITIWQNLSQSATLAFNEIKNSSNIKVIAGLYLHSSNSGNSMFLLAIMIISLFIGIFCYYLIKRSGMKFKKQSEKESSRLSGFLFLFLTRFSSGAGIGIAILCSSLQFSNSELGSFMMQTVFAIIIYSVTAAIVRVFFSRAYPQYRLYPANAAISSSYFSSVTNILTISFFWWLFFQFSMLVKWNVTSQFIAGSFKIVFTVFFSRFLYLLRNPLKNVIPDVKSNNKMVKSIGTILKFTVSHLYVAVFILLSALTVTSFSSSKVIYNYLLKSLLQTGAIILSISILFYVLKIIIKKIKKYCEMNTNNTFYFKQLIVTNGRLIEQGGYTLISIIGLLLLVNTWGLNVYRLVKLDIPFITSLIHVFSIIAVSFLLIQLVFLLIHGFQKETVRRISGNLKNDTEIQKRIDTLGNIFKKIAVTTIVIIASIMIIDELGFDIKAMLAGVGIVGLAVGFGAQNLVRDVISGLFVIFENRIRVGDVAIVNGTGGLVEQVNLRTTVLRGIDGTIHVFSNGSISSLSNMTHEFSFYVFDISVAYKENIDRVINVLKRVGNTMITEQEYRDFILEPLEIFGVDKFGSSEIIIKARIKTLPIKQWMIGREMNKRIKNEFEKEGIEIPFPHRSLFFSEASKPFTMKIDGLERLITRLSESEEMGSKGPAV